MKLAPLFDRYATAASLMTADNASAADMRAFISPLRYKNKMYLYGVNTEIGYNSQGHYLYIGPPDPRFDRSAAEFVYRRGRQEIQGRQSRKGL